MSAIFVKMPPATRNAAAPSDSPMAKPMKHGPAQIARNEQQDEQHDQQFDGDQQHPDAHAGLQRNRVARDTACPVRLANAVRELANVFTRMPNAATPKAARDADQAEQENDQLPWTLQRPLHTGTRSRRR